MGSGKVAMIVGGGSGMGAAAARRLAADGFHVAILSSSGKGEALAKELGGIGVTGSNQSNDDLQRLVDATVGKMGTHRRAGQQRGPRPPRAPAGDHRRAVAPGLRRLFHECRARRQAGGAAHDRAKGGAIVNISTAWVTEPSAMFPTSAVARAGLAAYTKLFADQYAPTMCA